MRYLQRIVPYVILALLCVTQRSFAQTQDEIDYNTKVSNKSAQAASALSDLANLYPQEATLISAKADAYDNLQAASTAYNSASSDYDTAVGEYNDAVAQKAADQAALNDLIGQRDTAYANKEADSAAISALMALMAQDADEISALWDEYSYGGDPGCLDAIADLSDEIDYYDSICDALASLYADDNAAYNSLAAQVSTWEALVSADQGVIDALGALVSARNSAKGAADSALVAAQAAYNTANGQLIVVQGSIEAKEDVYNTQIDWLSENSSYSIWVSNGRP